MKLDRNETENTDRWPGSGKYALILLRKVDDCRQGTFAALPEEIAKAFLLLEREGLLDMGYAGSPSEFFVMRLKDKYAKAALEAYADAANVDDPEWAQEVQDLAQRSGPNHPHCKRPD